MFLKWQNVRTFKKSEYFHKSQYMWVNFCLPPLNNQLVSRAFYNWNWAATIGTLLLSLETTSRKCFNCICSPGVVPPSPVSDWSIFRVGLNSERSDWPSALSVLVACQQPSGRGGEPSAFRFWGWIDTQWGAERPGRRSANAAVNNYNNHRGREKHGEPGTVLVSFRNGRFLRWKGQRAVGWQGKNGSSFSASEKRKKKPS